MTTAEWLLLGIVTFILIDFAAGRVIDFLNENSKNAPLSPIAESIATVLITEVNSSTLYLAVPYSRDLAYSSGL